MLVCGNCFGEFPAFENIMGTENYAGVQMMRVHYSQIPDVSGADHVVIVYMSSNTRSKCRSELAYF